MSTDRIVGIDLGTTNSLVAFMQGDRPVVIPGEDGVNLVPSVVALDDKEQIIVGNAARKYLIETPERTVYSIKRLMGRGIEDIQQELKLFPFRLAEDLQPGEVRHHLVPVDWACGRLCGRRLHRHAGAVRCGLRTGAGYGLRAGVEPHLFRVCAAGIAVGERHLFERHERTRTRDCGGVALAG